MSVKTVLAIAPHPDDETLGCGGSLLRHRAEGDQVHWLIVTEATMVIGADEHRVFERNREIETVAGHYGFAGVHRLGFSAAAIDRVPISDLVSALASMIAATHAETLYIPFAGDVHSDHGVVAAACISACKSFRQPSVRRMRAYETLSETEFQAGPGMAAFQPNLFIDITPYLAQKVAAMRVYGSEMAPFPFPRSEEAIRALAAFRGSTAGCLAAEAFMSLREFL